MRDDDGDRLVRFHEGLDEHTQYLRFFTAHPHLTDAEVERFTHVDHRDREALVATVGDAIVGVGRFDRLGAGSSTAEVAFVVAPAWRRHGIAMTMLHRLADLARPRGITGFVAETLPSNNAMRSVLARAGYPTTTRFVDGNVETTMDISRRPA